MKDGIPAYAKPDAPGIHLGYDNSVAVYQVVEAEQSFEQAAKEAVEMLHRAESDYPGWPRMYYLDIEGHKGEAVGFDPDFYEFQQEFLFSTIAPFVTVLETPLTGGLANPDPQRNDVPGRLRIAHDVRSHAGQVVPDHDPSDD